MTNDATHANSSCARSPRSPRRFAPRPSIRQKCCRAATGANRTTSGLRKSGMTPRARNASEIDCASSMHEAKRGRRAGCFAWRADGESQARTVLNRPRAMMNSVMRDGFLANRVRVPASSIGRSAPSIGAMLRTAGVPICKADAPMPGKNSSDISNMLSLCTLHQPASPASTRPSACEMPAIKIKTRDRAWPGVDAICNDPSLQNPRPNHRARAASRRRNATCRFR